MADKNKNQAEGTALPGTETTGTGTTGQAGTTDLQPQAGQAAAPAPAPAATTSGLQLTIKQASLDKVVGFNNSGAPLGERSQEDLLDLAIMARQSGNRNLLAHFDGELPDAEELLEAKAQQRLQKSSKKGTTATVPVPGLQGAGANPSPVTTPAAR